MIENGYAGLYLEVDLGEKQVRPLEIPQSWYGELIGGKGIGSRIMLERTPVGVDPLSAENVVVVNTGPFTGSSMPCSSRFNVSTKSPLTGAVASSSCGGSFGYHLKRAGVDGLVITGRSREPVYLHVEGRRVEIRDARRIWGLDTERAQESLQGSAKAVIGPAGENRVLFASLISQERAAGRCGTGAVLGSKNLKAITVTGNEKVRAAHPEAFKDDVKKLIAQLRKHYMTSGDGALHLYGTGVLLSRTNASNTLPTRNFARGSFEMADSISGEALTDTRLVGTAGCLTCPIKCERRVIHEGKEIKGPEYETLGLMGANLEIGDLDAIIEWNRICDLMGMDTISTGVTLGFAMELTEKGLLSSPLRFGRTVGVSEMLLDIAHRRGLGADLADGTMRMSEKYGGGEFAMHSRGLELASYEPRGAIGHGLCYALSNRGACHINGGNLVVLEAWGPITIDPLSQKSKPELAAMMQALVDTWSSLGLCAFLVFSLLPGSDALSDMTGPLASLTSKALLNCGPVIRTVLRRPGLLNLLPVPFRVLPYLKLLDDLTGAGLQLGDFIEVGQRVFNQERLFNQREGRAGAADRLPLRLTSVPQGPDPRSVVPLDDLLPRAYRVWGWDADGHPTDETLERLSIPRRLRLGPG